MEEKKVRTLKQIVYLMIAIMMFEIIILVFVLPNISVLVWVALGVIAMVAIYMSSLMLQLIKYLQRMNDKK